MWGGREEWEGNGGEEGKGSEGKGRIKEKKRGGGKEGKRRSFRMDT